MDETTLETLNLGSYTGIVIATMFAVEVLKRLFQDKKWFGDIPVWVYACVIAAILAVIANHFVYINGKPLLSGTNVWIAICKSVIGAAASSGFYTWLRNPESPKTASQMGDDSMKSKILPSLLLLFLVGCTCPEKVVLRESLAQAVQPAMTENIDLVDKIANNKPLPHFVQGDVDIRKKHQTEVNGLIDDDRKHDQQKGLFGQ